MIDLTVEAMELLQRSCIDDSGGFHGLRDRGLLESAVTRPVHLAYYRPEASLAELAATLAWGLIKNHAFLDGNKRIGFAALTTFLDLNGSCINCSEEEETAIVLRAAAGEITEEEWTVWVVAHCEAVT